MTNQPAKTRSRQDERRIVNAQNMTDKQQQKCWDEFQVQMLISKAESLQCLTAQLRATKTTAKGEVAPRQELAEVEILAGSWLWLRAQVPSLRGRKMPGRLE